MSASQQKLQICLSTHSKLDCSIGWENCSYWYRKIRFSCWRQFGIRARNWASLSQRKILKDTFCFPSPIVCQQQWLTSKIIYQDQEEKAAFLSIMFRRKFESYHNMQSTFRPRTIEELSFWIIWKARVWMYITHGDVYINSGIRLTSRN